MMLNGLPVLAEILAADYDRATNCFFRKDDSLFAAKFVMNSSQAVMHLGNRRHSSHP
jgi:hypothetical protein